MQIEIKTLKILNVAGFIFMIALNALANIIPINQITTGEVSDAYENLFTPAAITFSIWGVIYLLLGVFVVLSLFGKYESIVKNIGNFFFVSSILNGLWIVFWHYDLILISLILMVLLLITLIIIEMKIRKAKNIFFKIPFSIYLGWISVATIANVTVLLVANTFDGFGVKESLYVIAVTFVALLLALFYVFKRNDIAYSLVVLWAFLGIIIKHVTFYDKTYMEIIVMVVVYITLLILAILYKLFSNIKRRAWR